MFWEELLLEDREAISTAGGVRTYPAGSRIFLEGEASAYVLVIMRGHMKLTKTTTDGREALIELRGPGDLVGELAAVDDSPRAATAHAIDSLQAIVIPANRFRGLLLERARISYAVLSAVAVKLRQSASRRLEIVAGDSLARLCGRLVELADGQTPDQDDVIHIDSTLTQQELAEWIGVSRDAIVLALRRLRDLGWAETGRRQIRILDLEALKAAAAD